VLLQQADRVAEIEGCDTAPEVEPEGSSARVVKDESVPMEHRAVRHPPP
jgi:hypothetical protein